MEFGKIQNYSNFERSEKQGTKVDCFVNTIKVGFLDGNLAVRG